VATAGGKTPIGKNASSLTNPVSSTRRINPRLDRDDSGQLASYSTENTIKELAPTQKQPSDQEGKISAELRKLRAQYPDARSDLEAVAIGGQEAHADARQHLARVDDIVSKLDRAADQLQSVNTDQDSELNTLDRENNDLEKQVKDLEQRIDQLKQPRLKATDQPTQARSTDPQNEPAAKAEPTKAKDKPKTEPAKTSNIDPDELPPARKAELKQKATQALQNQEKFGKNTAALMARDISARLKKSSSARDNISPDEMAMIQKMVADEVGIEVGWYYHFTSNMHLYEDKIDMHLK
jgi:phage shock protein A